MIIKNLLDNYTTWLMEKWSPNQLWISFAEDAPNSFLKHFKEKDKLNEIFESKEFKNKLEKALEDSYDVSYGPDGGEEYFDSSQAVNNIVNLLKREL